MRFELVFLRFRPMVLSLARSTICSSTTLSSSRRRVHLACPSGLATISSAQLGYLLSGIDWRHPQETWRPTSVG
jgi:hypothetical protein